MRRWGVFILCLLLSGMLWMLRVLSQDYEEIISASVIPESSLDGRSSAASSPVAISAKCTATGYSLLRIHMRKHPSRFTISPEHLRYVSGDSYSISSSDLAGYVGHIFGPGVSAESFLDDSYTFLFDVESNRRVPVIVDDIITFSSQYMALGPVTVVPDSVTVYGDPSLLRNVNCIYTRQILDSDVDSDRHGLVRLIRPDGVRISDESVTYSLAVSRFVEMPVSVVVGTVNVPEGKELLVFPNMAEVTCRCAFPIRDCNPGDIMIHVDYDEFAESISGRCLPHCDNVPAGVISYSVRPEVFDCIEQ